MIAEDAFGPARFRFFEYGFPMSIDCTLCCMELSCALLRKIDEADLGHQAKLVSPVKKAKISAAVLHSGRAESTLCVACNPSLRLRDYTHKVLRNMEIKALREFCYNSFKYSLHFSFSRLIFRSLLFFPL